jgi:Pyruvate/2-oxoacid:ferredoxin oxidoreductase delta subunit
MNWEEEALARIEQVPVPPVMARLARLDAEMRAQRKGLDRVTLDIVLETEKGYVRTFGAEAVASITAMAEGKDPGLPEEFYEEDSEDLFSIQLCPAKYGACTAEKRGMMRDILKPVRQKLKAFNVTQIIMNKSEPPLMSHHVFTVSIIGCPNCCLSPYFSDFGIICLYQPEVNNDECVQCGACANYCTEQAIRFEKNQTIIDYAACVMCGGCINKCPVDALSISRTGYKVVVGGCGSRHPRLAQTVTQCTNKAGVLQILEKALKLFEQAPVDGKELSFHGVIKKHGVDGLRI